MCKDHSVTDKEAHSKCAMCQSVKITTSGHPFFFREHGNCETFLARALLHTISAVNTDPLREGERAAGKRNLISSQHPLWREIVFAAFPFDTHAGLSESRQLE